MSKPETSGTGNADGSEALRETISRGLAEALEEAERTGYVSAEETERRMAELIERHKNPERSPRLP